MFALVQLMFSWVEGDAVSEVNEQFMSRWHQQFTKQVFRHDDPNCTIY